MSDRLCPIQCPHYDSTVSCSCGQPGEPQRSSLRSKEIRNRPESQMDAPACESCGVPLIEHAGLYGTCAELQRVTKERDELRAQIAERRVVVPIGEKFTADCDINERGQVRISINNENRGVGYTLCGLAEMDGHFSRRSYDITTYLRHCLDTIGIRALDPATECVVGRSPYRELLRLVDEALHWSKLRPIDKRPDHLASIIKGLATLRERSE